MSWQRLVNRLWAEHETRYLLIMERALLKLRGTEDLPESEVELNRRLYFCLLAASREMFPNNVIAPVTECMNQPDPGDEARATREYKRPDFQWIYLDRYESDPRRSSNQFVVECKRLGRARRLDWVFNSLYSANGIERFLDPRWAYGKGARSGAMLGYWQSLKVEDVLEEVNGICVDRAIPQLVLVGRLSPQAVSKFEHNFVRPFQASPFRLHHLWIDLRF